VVIERGAICWAEPQGPGPGARFPVLVVQAGLCVFLLVMTAGLTYEAASLLPGTCRWPLTYYVRWLTFTDSWIALPVAVMFCFLMGRWLWYPRSQA